MEIGADPDVYNPIKKKLLELQVTESSEQRYSGFHTKNLFMVREKFRITAVAWESWPEIH